MADITDMVRLVNMGLSSMCLIFLLFTWRNTMGMARGHIMLRISICMFLIFSLSASYEMYRSEHDVPGIRTYILLVALFQLVWAMYLDRHDQPKK